MGLTQTYALREGWTVLHDQNNIGVNPAADRLPVNILNTEYRKLKEQKGDNGL